jgi:hypothetical protein
MNFQKIFSNLTRSNKMEDQFFTLNFLAFFHWNPLTLHCYDDFSS